MRTTNSVLFMNLVLHHINFVLYQQSVKENVRVLAENCRNLKVLDATGMPLCDPLVIQVL